MDEIGPFGPENRGELSRRVARRHRVEAPPFRLEGDDARTRRLDGGPVIAHAGDDRDLKPQFPRRPGHRQEVRGEEPVLGDHEDELAAGEAEGI
jgi:hypothetical protein